jgi:hypothetical protein
LLHSSVPAQPGHPCLYSQCWCTSLFRS